MFRRSDGGFFGKTDRVTPIVTISPFARLPSLCRLPPAFASLMVLVVICAGPGRAEPGATSVYQRQVEPAPTAESGNAAPATGAAARATAATGEPEDAAAQAERIVLSSAAVIARSQSFSVRFRQKARIGDRVLTGPGRYVQAGAGQEQRFRYESRLECDSESFELLEVCDGLFAWGYQRTAANPPTLLRVDVRRIRDKLEQWRVPDDDSASRYLGGLQRALWSIRQWFRFTAAEPAELDGLPAWRVEGHWDAERLAAILPEQAAAARRPGGIEPQELPDGVPWCVRLWVGRGDLLPRRVEWLAIPGPRPVAAADPEPVAILDLHDIEVGGRVDAAAFFYKPASAGLMDVTEQRVMTLGPWRP